MHLPNHFSRVHARQNDTKHFAVSPPAAAEQVHGPRARDGCYVLERPRPRSAGEERGAGSDEGPRPCDGWRRDPLDGRTYLGCFLRFRPFSGLSLENDESMRF